MLPLHGQYAVSRELLPFLDNDCISVVIGFLICEWTTTSWQQKYFRFGRAKAVALPNDEFALVCIETSQVFQLTIDKLNQLYPNRDTDNLRKIKQEAGLDEFRYPMEMDIDGLHYKLKTTHRNYPFYYGNFVNPEQGFEFKFTIELPPDLHQSGNLELLGIFCSSSGKFYTVWQFFGGYSGKIVSSQFQFVM